jgi:hypothetical protein
MVDRAVGPLLARANDDASGVTEALALLSPHVATSLKQGDKRLRGFMPSLVQKALTCSATGAWPCCGGPPTTSRRGSSRLSKRRARTMTTMFDPTSQSARPARRTAASPVHSCSPAHRGNIR